jgi:bacteriocin biosynthesis cyclodehydratase domain-containing protein
MQPRYRLVNCEIISVPGGAVLKRGVLEFSVNGDNVTDLLNALAHISKQPLDFNTLITYLTGRFSEIDIRLLRRFLSDLEQIGLLEVTESNQTIDNIDETPSSVLLWNYGITSRVAADFTSRSAITIVGLNTISLSFIEGMYDSGFRKFSLLDEPALRDALKPHHKARLEQFQNQVTILDSLSADELTESNILVIASTGSALSQLRTWNEKAFQLNVKFFPLWICDDTGFVGPLVIPGTSACFECFRARENSHLAAAATHRVVHDNLVTGSAGISYLPAIPDLLGKVGAFQLVKEFLQIRVGHSVNHVIRMDFMKFDISRSRLFKVPRCRICSSQGDRSPIDIDAIETNADDWIYEK